MLVPSDLEVAMAFVARREAQRSMPASRWVHVLSLDLGWMSPAEAKAFVARCVESGVLRPEGDSLRLPIDPGTVQVPVGFRPNPAATPAGPTQDPFLVWVDRLAVHDGVERSDVLARVAQVQQRMGGLVTALAALLWLCARSGLDVRQAARLATP